MNKLAKNNAPLPKNSLKIRKPKPKEHKFLMMYLQTGNATRAYIDAGYTAKTAQQGASRLLKKDVIQSYITQLQEDVLEESKIIFSTVVKRTNDLTIKAEKDNDHALTLKGLDQLAKLGHLYNKENAPGEERPAFVGISIHMGDKPSVELHRSSPGKDSELVESSNKKLPPAVTPAIDVDSKEVN